MQFIKNLIRKQQPAIDTRRAELIAEMQIAMRGLATALQKYEQNIDSTSIAYSQKLFAEIEVYREYYYTSRMDYEALYGDLTQYKDKLNKLELWTKERNITCLFQHPNQLYASAKQIS